MNSRLSCFSCPHVCWAALGNTGAGEHGRWGTLALGNICAGEHLRWGTLALGNIGAVVLVVVRKKEGRKIGREHNPPRRASPRAAAKRAQCSSAPMLQGARCCRARKTCFRSRMSSKGGFWSEIELARALDSGFGSEKALARASRAPSGATWAHKAPGGALKHSRATGQAEIT